MDGLTCFEEVSRTATSAVDVKGSRAIGQLVGRYGYVSAVSGKESALYLCNNHKNQPHRNIYGNGAFYDIYTTDRQAVWADHLVSGDTCIVASEPTKGRITFEWYTFAKEKRRRYGGKPTRVFFGNRFKSETLSRAEAIEDPLYSKLFTVNGRLKRQNLLRAI